VAWNTVDPTPCNILCPVSLALDVARVTVEGVPAATATLEQGGAGTPTVIWNDAEYAVFWVDQGGRLSARRIDRQGRTIDGQTVLITEPGSRIGPAAIGWNGREYV